MSASLLTWKRFAWRRETDILPLQKRHLAASAAAFGAAAATAAFAPWRPRGAAAFSVAGPKGEEKGRAFGPRQPMKRLSTDSHAPAGHKARKKGRARRRKKNPAAASSSSNVQRSSCGRPRRCPGETTRRPRPRGRAAIICVKTMFHLTPRLQLLRAG